MLTKEQTLPELTNGNGKVKFPRSYLGNKMRGIPEQNFPWFRTAAAHLREMGWDIVSPAELDILNGFDPASDLITDELLYTFMARDFEEILRPDVEAIILGPLWEDSVGARAERTVGEALGKKIYHYQEDGLPTICPVKIDQCTCVNSNGKASIITEFVKAKAEPKEVRITDPDTGGEKGSKQARFDLVPVYPLWTLAELYGYGCRKYASRNWERGYDWSLSYAALDRHLKLWWSGKDIDDGEGGSGLNHLAAVAWHAFALLEFSQTHPEKDDRPKGGGNIDE